MPTGRHHPRLSPFSFAHDFKTSPRFRSERNHSTLKIHPRLPPFSLCTILKSPPVPTLKIHPRLSPFSFAHDFKISPCSPDSSHSASQCSQPENKTDVESNGDDRRVTSPPATATVSVHSQRQTESPTFPKKVAQCSLHTLS